jgi:hypothetical protein
LGADETDALNARDGFAGEGTREIALEVE